MSERDYWSLPWKFDDGRPYIYWKNVGLVQVAESGYGWSVYHLGVYVPDQPTNMPKIGAMNWANEYIRKSQRKIEQEAIEKVTHVSRTTPQS